MLYTKCPLCQGKTPVYGEKAAHKLMKKHGLEEREIFGGFKVCKKCKEEAKK